MQTLCFVVAVLTTMQGLQADAEDPAATAIKTNCDVQVYLEAIHTALASKAETAKQAEADNKARRRKFAIAAAAAGKATDRCLLQAVAGQAAIAEAAAADQQRQTERIVGPALDAINDLLKLNTAAIALSKLELEFGNTAHRRVDGSSHATISKITAKADSTLICAKRNPGTENKIGGHTPDPNKLLKLPVLQPTELYKATKLNYLKLTMGASCSGAHDSYGNWATAASSCTQGTIASLAPAIDTTSKLGSEATPYKTGDVQLYDQADSTGKCNTANAQASSDTDPHKVAANKICGAIIHKPTSHTPLTLDGSTLSSNEDIKRIAAGCLGPFKDKTKLTAQEEEQLTNFLKEAYTKSKTDFGKKFKTLVEKKKVKVKKGDEIKSVDIETIDNEADEQDALARLTAQHVAEKLTEDQKPNTEDQVQSGKKTGEKKDGEKITGVNCSSHATQDACTKDQNCKWEGTECKDSSILVSKQFVLSVVSAAFMALLFLNKFSPLF
uniref:Variant surface glycoprotein 497 n=1 Tax=Trypanosoma brucei TaxID=5691 RepID=M4SY80_9TRYP|nr:variant surface glycoprotein 497 [Trypanosoma brucei]